MRRLSRVNALKIAAVLSLLLGLVGLFGALPYLARGAAALNQEIDSPPYFVIVTAFIFTILRLIGAYGVWNRQRWGIVLTLLVNALDSVLSAPGILFAPTIALQLASIVNVVASIVIIVLCLWREHKSAIV